FPQHEHAHERVDWALTLVHPAGNRSGGIEVPLGDLPAAICVDHQEWGCTAGSCSELGRVLHPQVITDIVRFGGAVQHDEENWLLPQRFELVTILSPPLHPYCEVSLVLDARHVGAGFVESCSDTLHGMLYNAINDRFLQRLVEDCPGDQ